MAGNKYQVKEPPENMSILEASDFWDEHSLLDFPDTQELGLREGDIRIEREVDKGGSKQMRRQARKALKDALEDFEPTVTLDSKGYTPRLRDNLLPAVRVGDFEKDLRQGDGNELDNKFRAAHSSSALVVNCFAPFRRHIGDLSLLGHQEFESIQFERKCRTGLPGKLPNLDVLVESSDVVIGIESKLTEHLDEHRAKFSPAYRDNIHDDRRKQGWFREMLRLMKDCERYVWLDAAQLIKHAFGLAHTYPGCETTLLYLYWEPVGSEDCPIIAEHRQEVEDFAARIKGSTPSFRALSYSELWESWTATAPGWLSQHLKRLRARYEIKCPNS